MMEMLIHKVEFEQKHRQRDHKPWKQLDYMILAVVLH